MARCRAHALDRVLAGQDVAPKLILLQSNDQMLYIHNNLTYFGYGEIKEKLNMGVYYKINQNDNFLQ